MAGLAGFHARAPKTKNMVVGGGLSALMLGVYFYPTRAADELHIAIDKFEELKHKDQKP